MIEKDRTYMVMGLLDSESIAFAIGKKIMDLGGRVVFTAQNEILTARYLKGDKKLSQAEREALDIRFCDVTAEDEVKQVFSGVENLAGVVHSIAYANPRTLLGEEFHTDAMDDVTRSYHISCASLATVAKHAQPKMQGGGSIVALTFDSQHAYPFYNWMGVHKAALEALVRALARRHGRDLVRVNAVSAGPLFTKAASHIPGFGALSDLWQRMSPLPWDPVNDKSAIADAAAFLLGPGSTRITGQVLTVDAGASIMGDRRLDFEDRG